MKKFLAFMFAALALALCGQRIDLDSLRDVIVQQARKDKTVDTVLHNRDIQRQEAHDIMDDMAH